MIELRHVYKTYGGDRHSLRDLSFQINKSDFTFLVGPSGAGKTTLFKLISAYEKPTTGELLVSGNSLSSLKEGQIPFYRRKIGFVFQNFKLLKNKTVFENIELPLRITNELSKKNLNNVEALIENLGLAGLKDQLPDYLSGGEQQRVAIARALVLQPELVVADEPTGNLDPALSDTIMDLFFEFAKHGTTFIVATHDMRLIKNKTCRVIGLDKGSLVEDSSI